MKLHCEWLVLCSRVLQDTESKQLTLVDCLEGVNAAAFPALHRGFAFAAKYRRDDSGGDPRPVAFRLSRYSDEDAEERVVAEMAGQVGRAEEVRVYANFLGLTLERPERLSFRIDHRIGKGAWKKGCATHVRVGELSIPDDVRAQLQARIDAITMPEAPAPSGGS